jgi:serine/threonine-protein kinase
MLSGGRAGQTGGTPPVENLSPQLLDGQVPSVADDVYAAGVLLHELLTGQPPFTDPDISAKIRNTPAAKILERRSQLQKAGGPVPPIWEKVIAACLERPRISARRVWRT